MKFQLNNYNRSITERLSIWSEGCYWVLMELIKEILTFPPKVGVMVIPRPEAALDEVCSTSFHQKPFIEACNAVERYARAVGVDCQVLFTAEGVEVAPLSWPGSSFGRTLHEALDDALFEPTNVN